VCFRRHALPQDGSPQQAAYSPAGFASEDGSASHYAGTDLYEAVTIAPGRQAWWVEPAANGGFRQRPIEARQI
jgi:hypothetical protein